MGSIKKIKIYKYIFLAIYISKSQGNLPRGSYGPKDEPIFFIILLQAVFLDHKNIFFS